MSGHAWRAMVALARVEAARLLRHPVTVIAVGLLVAPWVYRWLTGGDRYPILHDADRGTQIGVMFLLGGAALIVANLAVLRAHRHGTADSYDVLVLPRAWRTGAFLLALLPFGLVAAALVAARIGGLAAAPGAAGQFNPYELAVGPAAVVLLGAVGVLLARSVRSWIVAPLTLLGLGVCVLLGTMPGTPGWFRWVLPVALQEDFVPLPADLLGRPAGRHLAFVCALIVLVIGAALARTGARGARLVTTTAIGLVVAVVAGAVQFAPTSDAIRDGRVAATENPAAEQTCVQVEQVTYCAFDDFRPWVAGWDTVVRGVLRRAPAEVAQQPVAIRQRVDAVDSFGSGVTTAAEQEARAEAWRQLNVAAGTPHAVPVGTRWGDDRSEAALAAMLAYAIMTGEGPGSGGTVCGTRGVLIAWLAGQATPEAAAGLRDLDANSWGAVFFYEPTHQLGVLVDDRELTVALSLLEQPADEVAEVVRQAWGELTAAGTPTERMGELLGVPVPPALPEAERSTCAA